MVRLQNYNPTGDSAKLLLVTFERRDEETDKITGFKFFNVKKRMEKTDIEVDLSSVAIS